VDGRAPLLTGSEPIHLVTVRGASWLSPYRIVRVVMGTEETVIGAICVLGVMEDTTSRRQALLSFVVIQVTAVSAAHCQSN
jgi:hypothetical protein